MAQPRGRAERETINRFRKQRKNFLVRALSSRKEKKGAFLLERGAKGKRRGNFAEKRRPEKKKKKRGERGAEPAACGLQK